MSKIALRLLMGSVVSLVLAAPAMAETYTIDSMHTTVVWHVSHFGFSTPSGKFVNITGTMDIDEKTPAASKVNISFPTEQLYTGLKKFNEHLKSKDFFDVATYPTVTYASTKVDVTGKDTAIVHGNLTMHGVTKPVDMKVKLNKIGENMMKLKTAGFSATAALKRSDFGIVSYLPGVADDVAIDIEAEANLGAPAATTFAVPEPAAAPAAVVTKP